MLDGSAGWQLKHYFGGESRMLPPKLDDISFDYFDEVWAIRATTPKPGEDVFVILDTAADLGFQLVEAMGGG